MLLEEFRVVVFSLQPQRLDDELVLIYTHDKYASNEEKQSDN